MVVGAASCHNAAFSGTGIDGERVVQLNEIGGVSGIADDGDAARVGSDAVVPVAELPALVGRGSKVDCLAFRIGACAVHCASTSRVHIGQDGVLRWGRLGNTHVIDVPIMSPGA